MKTKKNYGQIIGNLAPYLGLIIVAVVFGIMTNGLIFKAASLKNILFSIITTAIAATGAVFVFGAGYFDMSLSGVIGFVEVLGAIVTVKTGSLVAGLVVIFVTSLAFGIAKGVFAATVNVPFFIFTIVLGSVLSSAGQSMLGNNASINANAYITRLSNDQKIMYHLIALIVYFVICLILFKLTPLSIQVKNMGGNLTSAKQSGINTKKTTLIAFIISAVGLALISSLILVRTRMGETSAAGSVGNDVMVALVLGGMPLSGGPKTKISAGLVGAATITLLNIGLSQVGVGPETIQIFRGVVFIVVVFISSFSYRSKLLPR